MPEAATSEPIVSVGNALTSFLRANPELEQKLAEPIKPEEAKADNPPPKIEPPARTTEAPKDEKPPEASKLKGSKVFGTEAKPPLSTPVVEPDKDETAGMPKKAQDRWNSLRESETSARRELSELRKQFDELGKQTNRDAELPKQLEASKVELSAMREQLAALEQELSVAAVDRSKDFQAKVAQPKAQIQSQVEAIAKKYDLPIKKVMAAMEEPVDVRTDALDEIATEMRDGDKQVLNLLGMEMDKITRTANELREKAKTSREHMLSDQQSQSEQQQHEARRHAVKVAEQVWKESSQKHSFLAGKTGDEAWDQWVSEQRGSFESLDVSDPAKLGEVLARSAQVPPLEKALDHYRGLYEQVQADNDALEQRLARYEKAQPGIGGHAGEAPSASQDDGRTPGQRIMSSVLARRV